MNHQHGRYGKERAGEHFAHEMLERQFGCSEIGNERTRVFEAVDNGYTCKSGFGSRLFADS